MKYRDQSHPYKAICNHDLYELNSDIICEIESMTSILIQNYIILKTEEQLYNAQCINKELSLGKEEMRNKARLS